MQGRSSMGEASRVPEEPITPPELYYNRRRFMRAGAATASVLATSSLYRWFNPTRQAESTETPIAQLEDVAESSSELLRQGFAVDEAWTEESSILGYNNFYEFSTSKRRVAEVARDFDTAGWQFTVDGLVARPRTFTMDELYSLSPPVERVYRMRCVEAWSMVIPWVGVPLAALLQAVEPLPDARFVSFTTLLDPARMPGQLTRVLQWPYVEGLRLDEALHPLSLLATGIYGKALAPQNGAPIRLVVPWKYGFKGIKSIVRISLVADQPVTSWNRSAPHEYGFYANVNPWVDHPRWSQATEQRIGEFGRRKTLMFNGYADQVAGLYEGMDLRRDF